MSVYRDCTGIPFAFQNETIVIDGNPLPKDASGLNDISSIIMKPDSNRWQNSKFGDTSPDCTPEYGFEYSCANGDEGTVQQFFYLSDPIILSGVPPRRGWNFYWESPCCRPGLVQNVNTTGAFSGNMLLRASMYATKDNTNVNPCIDSSPEFRSLPTTLICRGYEFTYNPTVIDFDLDSLKYGWDRSYNDPIAAPVPLPFRPGYNFNNPTDDKSFDVANTPSTLDPISGIIKMGVYSGSGNLKYITVIRVDSYREGKIIASVFREIPVTIFNCPPLPNGRPNSPPQVFIDNVPAEKVVKVITAGQTIRIPIQVVDPDVTGIGTQLQTLTLVPDGLLFSRDKVNPLPCEVTNGRGGTMNVEPCAYLQRQTPFLDATQTPPVPVIKGLGGIATEFVWTTDCRHIQTKTGVPGTNEGIYNFVMRVSDDHCPIPALNYPTITVKVKDPIPLEEPIMKGISIGLDGKATFNWVPPMDSALTFEKYLVAQAPTQNGVPPTNYIPLGSGEVNYYQFERREDQFSPFYFINGQPNLGPDILNKVANRDWYIRMQTLSGCTDTVKSVWSQPARIIEVDATPAGVAPDPVRSQIRLDWNRPKPLNAITKPYFTYESQTHYYIWANDSVSNGEVANPSNWYIVGDTNATTYTLSSTLCNDYAAYRIEARDTVIKPLYGNGITPPRDSLDTLYFSTFSIIDTMFVVNRGFIPVPKFDTVRVLANGNVFFRMDNRVKFTTERYKIYEDNAAGAILSDTRSDEDSVLLLGRGANAAIEKFVLEGVDGCDPTNVERSPVYSTILLNGNLQVPTCNKTFELDWNRPQGYTGQLGYRVYVSTDGGPFVLNQTVNGGARRAEVTGIKQGTNYKFQVVAFDASNRVNMSSILDYNSPAILRSFELVPPPELRCTYVNLDGSVTVYFNPPKRQDISYDSTDNATAYTFEYKPDGGNWQSFAVPAAITPLDTVDSIIVTGINAQQRKYEFRANTLAGCSGTEPYKVNNNVVNSNIVSSIFVSATPRVNDPAKRGDIEWNSNGNLVTEEFFLFKDTATTSYSGLAFGTLFGTDTVDNTNGPVCNGVYRYYVTIEDDFFSRPWGNQFLPTCVSRSNLADAQYIDNLPPGAQDLDYITYDLKTNEIVAHWSAANKAADVDTIIFLTPGEINSGLQSYRDLDREAFDAIDSLSIHKDSLDASDSSVFVGVQSLDACGNASSEGDISFHKSIDVEVKWDQCDSNMVVRWNAYVGFDTAYGIEYTVYFDTTGNYKFFELIPNSTTTDTVFKHKIYDGARNYRYHVRARSLEPNTNYVSNSNIGVDSAAFNAEPRYGYLQYATVLSTEEVELKFYKDTLVDVKGYTIYKGNEKRALSPIGFVDYTTVEKDTSFTFIDANVDVNGYSYYYRISTSNPCGAVVSKSNFGRSILLQVEPDNAGLVNKLTWSEYDGWDSTVAYYNIYRGVGEVAGTQVHAVVAPNEGYRYNTFVDDVYDEATAGGEFCYRIEAVQGPISDDALNGYSHKLSSATSVSNDVCITQQPLFYIPNAFAPNGINKTFGPKGQFFDFTRYEMVIYNRWGDEIFRTRDINKGWDGTVNGEEATLGSYVYMIRFVGADGQEHRRKGTVTLLK
jgi:gliding motility-associated-like protein